ncbi:MAG: hypothetical protein IPL46_23940 [Saprospiraceae bacterium]|nr:hypothetical protein [Saprospiraceae bacterium]
MTKFSRAIGLLVLLIGGVLSCSPHTGAITTKSSGGATAVEKPPKNVILMIGDGMGLSQITGAMYSERRGLQIERFKNIGFQKTH